MYVLYRDTQDDAIPYIVTCLGENWGYFSESINEAFRKRCKKAESIEDYIVVELCRGESLEEIKLLMLLES